MTSFIHFSFIEKYFLFSFRDTHTHTDIIHGKLDQKNKQLEVDYAIGRDIRTEDVKKISATLQEWCDSCESVLHTIENQIDRANLAKAMRTKHTEDLDTEVCCSNNPFPFLFRYWVSLRADILCQNWKISDCKFEEKSKVEFD